jgi:hypothetical protein
VIGRKVFTKFNPRTANHGSKPPFSVPVVSNYFQRFASGGQAMKKKADNENRVPANPQLDQRESEPPTGKPFATSKPKSGTGKRIARWMLWLIIIFGLGATTMAVFVYFPLQQKQKAAEAILVTSSQKIAADEQKIESLTLQKTDLEGKNKALESQLNQANLCLAVLNAKSDIMAAGLAVSDGDPISARLSLEKATIAMQTLTSLLEEGSLSEALTAIQGHLEQVKDKLNNGIQNTQPDLDILIDNLSALEDALNN